MGFRTNAEVEASFRPIERVLDAMLEKVRVRLDHEGIIICDDSNRLGFGGGFPHFIWSFSFEKRADFGSEIKRATVWLWYLEPALVRKSQRIEVTSKAEIFQIGKQSRVHEISKMVYPIEQFLRIRMEQIIMDGLAVAEQILSKY